MYLNIDINSVCTPFLNMIAKDNNVTKKRVCTMLEPYKNTYVTDILFDIFCQYSAVDSDVFTDYADKFLQKHENGVEVDYTDKYIGIYTLNKKHCIDPYKVWIEDCRENGINPWISVRMNDCHCPDDAACFLRGEFFYEAKVKGWMIGEKYGYFRNQFDYAVPEVRQKMICYIEEQINRYDVYGIELDFMREIFCFDYIDADNAECVSIMNDFIRNVKKIVSYAEEKWGHKIKIAVRLNRDIDQNLIFGFDARTWAKEELVDIIIPSPRWERSDSLIPIDVWKRELSNIEIPVCIESHAATIFGGPASTTAEMVRGIAGGYLSDGADGIYLYNYFGDEDKDRDAEVYRTCGTIGEITKHPTRYAIIGQEKSMAPYGLKPCDPLPLELCESCEEIEINTAEITDNKKITLIVGFTDGSPADVKISFNGVLCEDFERIETPEPKKAMVQETKCYRCRVFSVAKRKQQISFQPNKSVRISWIEIDVR